MQEGDIILKIENIDCSALSIKDIEHCIHGQAKALDLLVWKNPEDMVKLIKKKDNTSTAGDRMHSNGYHEDKQTNCKFELKYPHEYIDFNKFNQQPQAQQGRKNNSDLKIYKNNTLTEIKEKVIQERKEELINDCHTSTRSYSNNILNGTSENSQNFVRPNENGDKNRLSNNIVYNNVHNSNARKVLNIHDGEKINTVLNVQSASSYENSSSKTNLRDEQTREVYKNNSCYDTNAGFSNTKNQNVRYTKAQHKINETYLVEENNGQIRKSPQMEIDFEPLANSTLLRNPSDGGNTNKKAEHKKDKDDEDDIDAQFTKCYQNMIESKQENQKSKLNKSKSPIQYNITTGLDSKSNALLFNQNYQSKIEDHKRITKSSERVINEGKKEIKQLVKKDYSNAEWSGKTEVYYTTQNLTHNVNRQEEHESNDIDFIDDNNNDDDDEPYNELEKNPMFNRLRIIEDQIERCMTPERLERETQFNDKFEEYYKEKTSKSNLMNSRWHAHGKQHSEENLHTPSKPSILRPNERLTDPRGVFFKKRYEECVKSSRNSMDEKRTTGFNYSKTGFNNSRKFWKEMEKNCPGNSSDYRTHFVKLQDKFKEKPSVIAKETKDLEPLSKCFSPYDNHVETDHIESRVKKENRAPLHEVHEPLIIPKHIDNDRSKTPVGFYENKKPKLKVEIPKTSIEKIQTFAQAKNEDRKLRSPVAENLEKIIASNSSSRRSSKNGDTPPNEQMDHAKKRSDCTFRTITPNPSSIDGCEVRSSGGFTPTSPFYYEKLKESPVFMGIKVKIAEDSDCKRCTICGEEPECEELEETGDVSDVQDVGEDVVSPFGCCAGVKFCNE